MKRFCPKCGHRMIHGLTAWICAECGFEELLEEAKMTRGEIRKDLERIKGFGNYPARNCECNACTLIRYTIFLLSECEGLEAKIKKLEGGVNELWTYLGSSRVDNIFLIEARRMYRKLIENK